MYQLGLNQRDLLQVIQNKIYHGGLTLSNVRASARVYVRMLFLYLMLGPKGRMSVKWGRAGSHENEWILVSVSVSVMWVTWRRSWRSSSWLCMHTWPTIRRDRRPSSSWNTKNCCPMTPPWASRSETMYVSCGRTWSYTCTPELRGGCCFAYTFLTSCPSLP